MLPIYVVITFLSVYILFPHYHCRADSNSLTEVESYFPFIETEDKLFGETGVCDFNNRSYLHMCSFDDTDTVRTLQQLQSASCYCDYSCHRYGDCCINRISQFDYSSDTLTCRMIRSPYNGNIPIYVHQKCPDDWKDELTKDLCEKEALERYKLQLSYDHRQDVPVFSESFRLFYRNVYCAICNKDTNLAKWDTHLYCNGVSNLTNKELRNYPDFSSSVYNPRTKNYRGVKINGIYTNCNLLVHNFKLNRLIMEYGARLCKNVIDNCPDNSNPITAKKCKMYSSYIYHSTAKSSVRDVYKNFHCAICNKIPFEKLNCTDPYFPILYTDNWQGRLGLNLLFDFNHQGDNNIEPCKLSDGFMWDPVFRKCQNVTCGISYRKEGGKCIPLDEDKQPEEACFSYTMEKDLFTVLSNGNIYVNYSDTTLTTDEFKIHKNDTSGATTILVCIKNSQQLLPISDAHYWISTISLSISIICLTLHLLIYGLFKILRNNPGKTLMCLAFSLICGHLSLLLGRHFIGTHWLCYLSSICMHFGYISAFSWMNVMAFDIYKTFSSTNTQRSRKKEVFLKYSAYAWLTSTCLVIISITIDTTFPKSSAFRPKYGNPICWFNEKYGLVLFFIIPVAILLSVNLFLFIRTAITIFEVTRQTKLVNKFSDKIRYILYLKLTVVFGLTWILGFIAAITDMDLFWYPFIILNGLQGALIFLSFAVKKKVIKMLSIKFRVRSSKYRMAKRTGLKAAMYTSLSNLSSFPPTLSTQLSSPPESREILKSVRKINPDILTETKPNK